MSERVDAVVIGGGINGVSIAYALRRAGAGRVMLLEKGHIASGPTGLSSGVVRQHYSTESLAAMARDSLKVWQNFDEVIGGDAGFVQCGVVFFAGARDAGAVRSSYEMHRRIGIREELLGPEALIELEPALYADDIEVGAYEPDGGYADPAAAAFGFADAATRAGVEIRRNTEVLAVTVDQGRVHSVLTAVGRVHTETVVVAAGPWTPKIVATAGIHLPIRASRHAVVMFRRPPVWTQDTLVFGDLVRGWYFKPESGAQIMTGSIRDTADSVDCEDFSRVPSEEERTEYGAALMHRLPIMKEGSVSGGWAALYDVTPDWQPIIGELEIRGLFCAAGFSGHGFKIAPAIGTAVSQLVMSGACTDYDLQPFAPQRFLQSTSSHGSYSFGILG